MSSETALPLICSSDRLADIVRTIFSAAGSSDREAGLIADHLIQANLRGHDSHGVGMIPAYINNARAGELVLNQSLAIALDTGSLVICDGQAGAGQVMAHDAMVIGIDRALTTGSCILGLRNSHHIGRIGHWAEQCAAAGLVSIHFVNVVSEPSVAPFGGTSARVGTNPFAVGIPRPNQEPIVVDFATSKWAVGKVRVALNKGEQVPPGTLLDAAGQPTTDPAALFAAPGGALLPFGDHKGWGLSLACELLGGALTGGKTQSGPKRRDAIINSMLSILVCPEKLGTSQTFGHEIDAFVAWAQSDVSGAAAVLLPGDPERVTKQRREQDGIPIDRMTWEQILVAGERVGLTRAELLRSI
jgi:hydroxycarboxylate dehydrogenase B